MSDKYENMSVFEQLKAGLEDSIAFSRGELSLKTTELPAPPPETRPAAITSLRKRLRMSQSVFAATLNVSTRTVQSWEQGAREPSDAALRMLQVIRERPDVVRSIFAATRTRRARNGTSQRRATSRTHLARVSRKTTAKIHS